MLVACVCYLRVFVFAFVCVCLCLNPGLFVARRSALMEFLELRLLSSSRMDPVMNEKNYSLMLDLVCLCVVLAIVVFSGCVFLFVGIMLRSLASIVFTSLPWHGFLVLFAILGRFERIVAGAFCRPCCVLFAFFLARSIGSYLLVVSVSLWTFDRGGLVRQCRRVGARFVAVAWCH